MGVEIKSVVLVGDSDDIMKPVRDFLRNFAYPDVQHLRAARAVNECTNLSDGTLVILDLDAEDGAGMDTLGLLSTKAAAGQVKVIALTGNPSKSIIEKAKSARVSAVLTKPFSPAQLVDRITSLAS